MSSGMAGDRSGLAGLPYGVGGSIHYSKVTTLCVSAVCVSVQTWPTNKMLNSTPLSVLILLTLLLHQHYILWESVH